MTDKPLTDRPSHAPKRPAAGMSRSELYGWAAIALGAVLLIGLSLAIQSDKSDALVLALLVVPLLIVLVAPQLAVYGGLAFALNLVLAQLKVPNRAIVTLIVLAGLGVGGAILANAGASLSIKAQTRGDFQAPPATAPSAVALLLPADAKEKNGDPGLCGEYCLRLLYTGEAATVLVGTTPDTPSAAFDMNTVPVHAYFIGKGASCAPAGMSFGAGSDDPGFSAYSAIPQAVRTRSESGECLETRPATLKEAGLVVLERSLGTTGDNEMKVRRMELYRQGPGGWTPTARKTYVDFRPVMTPLLFWMTPDFRVGVVRSFHAGDYKPLKRMAFLRDVAGLKLDQPDSVSPAALRSLVEHSLADAGKSQAVDGHVQQAAESDVSTYLQSLAGREATDDDVRLVQRILAKPDLPDSDLFYFYGAVRHMGVQAAPLAPLLVKDIAEDDPERHSERIRIMSQAFTALPQDAQAPHYPDLFKVAQDPARYAAAWQALSHLAYGPPAQALPLFNRLAASDGPEGYNARRLGEVGLCLMGHNALPAKDLILDRAVDGKGGHALLVAVYRLGLFEQYKEMRSAVPRSSVEQQNDGNTFRFFPRRMTFEMQRDHGDMDAICQE